MQRGGTTEGWSQVAEGLECQVHLQMRKPRPREIWLSFCPFLSYILTRVLEWGAIAICLFRVQFFSVVVFVVVA